MASLWKTSVGHESLRDTSNPCLLIDLLGPV